MFATASAVVKIYSWSNSNRLLLKSWARFLVQLMISQRRVVRRRKISWKVLKRACCCKRESMLVSSRRGLRSRESHSLCGKSLRCSSIWIRQWARRSSMSLNATTESFSRTSTPWSLVKMITETIWLRGKRSPKKEAKRARIRRCHPRCKSLLSRRMMMLSSLLRNWTPLTTKNKTSWLSMKRMKMTQMKMTTILR